MLLTDKAAHPGVNNTCLAQNKRARGMRLTKCGLFPTVSLNLNKKKVTHVPVFFLFSNSPSVAHTLFSVPAIMLNTETRDLLAEMSADLPFNASIEQCLI